MVSVTPAMRMITNHAQHTGGVLHASLEVFVLKVTACVGTKVNGHVNVCMDISQTQYRKRSLRLRRCCN